MVGSLYHDNDQFLLIPGGDASGYAKVPLAKMEDLGKAVETGRHQEHEGIGYAWRSWEGMVYRCSGRGDGRPVYQLPSPGVQPSEWDPCVSLRIQSILVGDK